MKKLLIGLTIFFSFLFVSNVNAAILDETYIINENIFDSDSYNTIISGSRVSNINYYMDLKNKNKFDNFDSYVKSLNYKYYIYDTDYIYLWNSDDIKIYFTGVYDSTNGSNFSFRLINNNNESYAKISLYSYLYSNSTTITNYSNKIEYLGLFIHATSSSPYSYFSAFNSKCYSNKQLQYFNFVGFDTNSNIYYLGNDIYEPSLKVYNSVIINNILYNDGDLVYSLGPKIYKFENEIDTSNIDFIRFKLDVNDIIFNENFVQFNYSLNGNSLDRLLYPYIETLYDYYLTSDDNETFTVLYKTYELSSYSNNIIENIDQDFNSTVYYNFVVDTRTFNDNLFLSFDSYYNFEVEIYNSDGTSEVLYNTGSTLASNDYLPDYNMITLDLSDYKGVVLVPKVYSTTDNLGLIYNAIKYDQDYKIFLNGNYDIYIRSTPGNYVTLTDTFKDYSNLYFSKRFKYVSFIDNKNTNIIRLVKSSSNENHLITFDSNMYSYSFINSSDEVVILPDPNLPDNTINTGTIDEDVSLDEANNTFQDSELSITKFINDIDETLNYVHNVFNIFFNKLPILIQSLLIFVFNIVCIFMLLRMGGWLG